MSKLASSNAVAVANKPAPTVKPRPAQANGTIGRSGNASRKASGTQAVRKPSLIQGLAEGIDVLLVSEPSQVDRLNLVMEKVVEHVQPPLAILVAEVDGRPLTRMHHDESLQNLEAVELRQTLLDQIIDQVRDESASRAFLKRHQGKQYSIVAVPIRRPGSAAVVGTMAVVLRETRNDRIKEHVHFVETLCSLAGRNDRPAKVSVAAATPEESSLDDVLRAMAFDCERALAFKIVNGIAAKFHCEQVCLGVVVGREVRLIALSGSPSVKRNSPSTLATQHAMAECLDQKQLVAFPALKARDSAPGNRLHQNLAKATGQPALCSIPVRVGDSIVGVVMLRRPTGDSYSSEELTRLEERLAPCGPALQLLAKGSRSLKQHVIDVSKQSMRNCLTRPVKLLMLFGVVALLGWLCVGRTTYRPSCASQLAAAHLQHIAAPLDGVVEQVFVQSGQEVAAGDALLQFDASGLQLERDMLRADIGEASVDLKSAIVAHDPRAAALQRAKIQAIEAKLAGVEQRLARTRIFAPDHGRVIRCDLSTKIGQEFKFGMPLMELAIGREWNIQIDIPDTIAPYVTVGQVGTFSPFGRPGESYSFEIVSVSGSADVKDGGNVFIADAKLVVPSDASLDWMRVGMSGVACIETESKPVYWVYFHDLLDWFHKTLWY